MDILLALTICWRTICFQYIGFYNVCTTSQHTLDLSTQYSNTCLSQFSAKSHLHRIGCHGEVKDVKIGGEAIKIYKPSQKDIEPCVFCGQNTVANMIFG